MDKQKLIETVCLQLEKDLSTLKDAARATHEAATSEESKPENQYDTRAIEASYLAEAQAKRVLEIEEQLGIFKSISLKEFAPHDSIAPLALVETTCNGKRSFILLMMKGGGLSFRFESQSVLTITPHSPLGEALIGLKAGDIAEVENGDHVHEYKIISVC